MTMTHADGERWRRDVREKLATKAHPVHRSLQQLVLFHQVLQLHKVRAASRPFTLQLVTDSRDAVLQLNNASATRPEFIGQARARVDQFGDFMAQALTLA